MTPEEMRMEIARSLGKCVPCPEGQHEPYPVNIFAGVQMFLCKKCQCSKSSADGIWMVDEGDYPDYPNDLNAMNEVEKTLTPIERADMEDHLWLVIAKYNNDKGREGCLRLWQATAEQHAEAYLKMKGRWK